MLLRAQQNHSAMCVVQIFHGLEREGKMEMADDKRKGIRRSSSHIATPRTRGGQACPKPRRVAAYAWPCSCYVVL